MQTIINELTEKFPNIIFHNVHEKWYCEIHDVLYRLIFRNPYSYQLILIK